MRLLLSDFIVPSLRSEESVQKMSAFRSGLRSISITTARLILLRSFTTGQKTASWLSPRLEMEPRPGKKLKPRDFSVGLAGAAGQGLAVLGQRWACESGQAQRYQRGHRP